MRPSAGEVGWLALAAVVGLLTVLNTVVCLVALFRGSWLALVRGPAWLLFGYWIVVGAWRRTSWGRVTVEAHVVGPSIGAGHAAAMTLVAVACIIALLLALAVQTVLGRA